MFLNTDWKVKEGFSQSIITGRLLRINDGQLLYNYPRNGGDAQHGRYSDGNRGP